MDATEKMHITRDELIEALGLPGRGAQPVTIVTETDSRMVKKHRQTGDPNPYLGRVVKRSRVNGMVNWVYANSVNRQRGREGEEQDFTPEPRKWGERVAGTPFVAHKGALYLELKVERAVEEPVYLCDGQEIDRAQIAAYLPKRRSNAGHQGVEQEVILRDYRVDSIREITFGGRHCIVVG